MTRSELLKSPEYWVTGIQIDLYNCAEKFMERNNMNRTQLAKHLGVSKGYISQLLNGDYDHKLSKLVELSLAFGYIPNVQFEEVDLYIANDTQTSETSIWKTASYSKGETTPKESAKNEFTQPNYNLKLAA